MKKYSAADVIRYVRENEVKFIRLTFFDIYGTMKAISLMPNELDRSFRYGIAVDASAIAGYGCEEKADLFLHPEPETMILLPWRPEQGKMIRLFCTVTRPDGSVFENDSRSILKNAVAEAKKSGLEFSFGVENEFYLFKLDADGNETMVPCDHAGMMDIAPVDKCENVRREICLALEGMGIPLEGSAHEEGPGQNKIDFRYYDAVSAADNIATFRSVAKFAAARSNLWASFEPKPLADEAGSSLHINVAVSGENPKADYRQEMVAGILDVVRDMTLFLNPDEKSYLRFGSRKAPKYVSWSTENRFPLVRVLPDYGPFRRVQLRSPDAMTNPYLAFALLIYACLRGIAGNMTPPEPANLNLFRAGEETLKAYETLPATRAEAAELAKNSRFIAAHLPKTLIDEYCG